MKKPRKPPSARRAPTYDDLLQIVQLIESGSRFSEFRLRSGDIEVEIRRANGAQVASTQPARTAQQEEPQGGESAGPAAPIALPQGATVVRAPMVGTFYRAPAPGAAPFVEPGSRVGPETIVCIIEVMKLMNSIPAGVAGVVTQVLAQDGEAVEYGQPLLAIDPDR